jgi:hypothetical protein
LVAIGSILPSIFHGKICNDRLLQLIDCIELMKNEVKKKMHALNERCCTKVTERQARTRKSPPRATKTSHEHAIARDENAAAIEPTGVKQSCAET